MMRLLLTACFLILQAVLNVSSANCTSPWIANADYCYLFHNVTDTLFGHSRNDSRLICQRMGGDLLSIKDQREQNFITKQFNDSFIKKQHYWIGLSDLRKKGQFEWSDGTPYNKARFSNWDYNEPNNWHNEEHCGKTTFNGKWNDNSCRREFGFICKRRKDAVIPVTPTLPPFPDTTEPITCEAGWIPWGTSCYGIIRGLPKTWTDARSDCLRRFGDLIVIDSKEEQDFLTNEIALTTAEFWIGLTDRFIEKTFYWVDKTPLNNSIANWKKNEPSNDFGNEDCVEMYGKYLPGKWNDNHCRSLRSYICEKKSGVHNCPQEWLMNGDNCYQINAHPNQRTTWQKARKICLDFNQRWEKSISVAEADLVSITSKEENEYLIQQFRNQGITSTSRYFWTGLYKNGTKGFLWSDHTTNKFINWHRGKNGQSKSYNATFVCVKGLLDNSNSGWFPAPCSEINYFACKVKRGKDRCFDPIGVQSFKIPNSAITASGQLSEATPPAAARLYLKAGNSLDGAWCEKNSTEVPWLQVDLGQPEKLTYISLQGKSNSNAFVTLFYLKYSMDGISWDVYGDIPPTQYYKFKSYPSWRSNFEKVMNLPLPTPFVARYIRIFPMEWIYGCCMRVEFYGCQQDVLSQQCGLGWREDKNTHTCYKFSSQKTTWDAAQSICSVQGANLVSITTPAERDYIKAQIKLLRSFDYWTGLNDLDREGVFKWNDFSPLTLTNWYRSNPEYKGVTTNCVAIKAGGYWADNDCTVYKNFICKKTYKHPYTPKKSFNNNWISATDYYWPLGLIENNTAAGTKPAQAFGKFSNSDWFPSGNGETRRVLHLNGKTNYLKINDKTCLSYPDSHSCPHGLSVSFLFKYINTKSRGPYNILSTGSYSVSINNNRIKVMLMGPSRMYQVYARFSSAWNSFAFTWSSLTGLKLYMNGELKKSMLSGFSSTFSLYLGLTLLNQPKHLGLYIGRLLHYGKALKYTEIKLASLAIYERVISPAEVSNIHVAEFGQCKWGQIMLGSMCYEFNSTRVNWVTAQQTCRNNGGDLMSVHTPVEQAFLSLSVGKYGLLDQCWIGLNSKARNHGYTWSDGSSLSFSHWGVTEPDNYDYYNCVNTWSSGFWNDNRCYSKMSFACQYQKTIIATETEVKDTYYASFNYFQARTFGCPLSKIVQLINVTYGVKDNCVLPNDFAKKIVASRCVKSKCVNIRATDWFFNRTNPCKGRVIRSSTKRMTISYKCGIDPFPDASGCHKGYKVYYDEDRCFKLYPEKKTATQAAAICKNESGGALAAIGSRNQMLFLTVMTADLYEKSDIWIGMKFDPTTSTYFWMNGHPVDYTNWYNKQPDPRIGHYVTASLQQGSTNFMFWKPASEKETHPFFCQHFKAHHTEAPRVTSTRSKDSCQKNWTRINNDCFYINTNRLSFVAAEFACAKMGKNTHLASILSYFENHIIFNQFVNNSLYFAWIGLSNEAVVNGFRWLDNKPLAYLNWYTGRPHTGLRHLCGGMSSGGKWWDLACYSKYASICKGPIVVLDKIFPVTTPKSTKVTPTQDPKACPSLEWRLYNGSCYYFNHRTTLLDFHSATVYCNKMNSHLASVHNDKENAFIYNGMRRRPYFIGLHDISTESGWEWVDKSVVNYVNFGRNQPNNWHGMEDCIAVENPYYGKWNDVPCNMKLSFVCKKTNDTIHIATPKPLPDTGFCEGGWVLYGSKCYLFIHGEGKRRNYAGALDYCRKEMYGDLVSIHSNYENAFILSQLYDLTESVFIGLSDRIFERTFLWSDQSPVNYTNWYPRQPSRYGNEDCVEILPYFKHHGRWNDIRCEQETGFVCQREHSIAKPATKKPPTTTGPPCPKGYKKYQKSCYFINKTPMTWSDASKECRKQDKGNLVSLHSPSEQAFMFSYFAQYAQYTWIGLHKAKNEVGYHWSDNTPFDYYYWKHVIIGNPSKYSEKCISQEFSSTVDGKWKDTACTKELPFACKISRVDPSKVPTFVGNCSEGWLKYKDKCYKYFKSYKYRGTWSESREKCKAYGGDLVTIDSKELQHKIHKLIQQEWTPVWIGLNDRAKEHVFTWSSGATFNDLSYKNWGLSEFSDNSGTENCVQIMSTSGQWNDLTCYRKLPFVCEHSLECREALGMQSKAIPDSNIKATSYYGQYYPTRARLNLKQGRFATAWCTNITYPKQSLTINLGELMTITRINTQGLHRAGAFYNNYVISYRLDYSNDGKNWKQYTSDDPSHTRLLPGNRNAIVVEGTTVNIKATFLKFTPTRIKGHLTCLRLELFGCKSVCSRALGMISHGIANNHISVSSEDKKFPKQNARPIYQDKWCTLTNDLNQWLQIDLVNPMKITRVMVLADNLMYLLLFSDNAKDWRKYKMFAGTDELFRSPPTIHELGRPETSRYVRIQPIKWTNKICLQVELYGCTYECDSAFGIESPLKIPNSLITATSFLPLFPPENGRLYQGKYNSNSWCAKSNDISQYLQIDFTQNARVTYIATQGFNGDNAKYVKTYHLQWSTDGNFWHHVDGEMTGNSNGYLENRVKLKEPVLAHYIRINPVKYFSGICMRVEIYGCPLETITVPTESPPPKKKTYYGSIRLTGEKYSKNLESKTSPEFKALANRVQLSITDIYLGSESFRNGFDGVTVTAFKPGSVITEFTLTVLSTSDGPDDIEPLKKAVAQGALGEFAVDIKSLKISTKRNRTSPPIKRGGLSNGGKIGLIVFVVLLIVVIVGVGVVYCCRKSRNGFKLQYSHKAFENPVHMDLNNDELDFMNDSD